MVPIRCSGRRLLKSIARLATFVLSSFFSERRHTAREQQAEARITYPFHPRFGETVGVRRRLERGGAAFLVVHQLDGTFACLPAWMTDEAASRFEIGVEPRFPLDVLCSLRNEVDALLGFLASESKTERPENVNRRGVPTPIGGLSY